MTQAAISKPQTRSTKAAVLLNRWAFWFSHHWLLVFSLIYGLYVGLPFFAPVFMALGLEFPGRIVYTIYSFLCHQLPQRSYFLFGEHFTYSLAEIQLVWPGTGDLAVLRQFTGNPEMGWKVAWSDRMVSMYTSILIFAWIWFPLRRKIPVLCWQGLVLLGLPMFFDGASHMVSDIAGLGNGFRDTNTWLGALTNQSFAPTFYSGDGWGSFNSIMRLLTGTLFGLGIVWFGFPYLDDFFLETKIRIQEKFKRAGIPLENKKS